MREKPASVEHIFSWTQLDRMLGECDIVVLSCALLRVEDEAWWINPNSASPALVEALLRVSGSDAESARRLASAISEWVGSAPAPRPPNALLAEYQAAGPDYAPPAVPLETLNELGRVVGMNPAVLATIRPRLTLCGPPQPNAATADPVVAAALTAASQAEVAPSRCSRLRTC
jgi:general secretion pathway protein K